MSNDLLEPRGKNRNYFAARGGDLVYLVPLVYLVCLVRRTRETGETRQTRALATLAGPRVPLVCPSSPPATVKDCGPTVMSPW